ncbi:MAG: sugar phosphate isomerase/epimerase [Candidatus Omnitrophota bacterium]|nr:MAG: sugar phosphate isomerase/epimerase [Candidatus Omnitrophota bacterium]
MKTSRFAVVIAAVLAGIFFSPVSSIANVFPPELCVGGFMIGPQAYSFNRYSFFEAVEKAKEVGCNVIEAYPGQRLNPEDKTGFDHNASPSVWAKALMKLEATGVRLVNYGVVGLGNDEAEARKVFDFAKIMGIPTITSEPQENSFDLLEKLVKEYNIKLAIHNHPKRADNPGYKYWDPNFVLECVKGRDPRVGACADTGHWIRSDVKPIEALKILEGRIVSSHLKDLNQFAPDAHDVPFGKGVADIKACLDELKRQGFSGNISIEYEYNWTTSVPEIKECVDFVREYGKTN